MALTRAYLARGEAVIGTCRQPENATEVLELAKAYPERLNIYPLEVSDADSIKALAGLLASRDIVIDILINNAGMMSDKTADIATVDAAAMLQVFAVNSVSPLMVTQALLPFVEAASAPVVVNITSILGSKATVAGGFGWFNYGYNASKAALNMIGLMMGRELEEKGIAVLNMHPGWVQTDMGGKEATFTPEQSAAMLLHQIDTVDRSRIGAYLDPEGNTLPW